LALIVDQENMMKQSRKVSYLFAMLFSLLLMASLAPLSAGAQGESSTWRGEYFPNRHLSGNPTLLLDEARIDFNWGTGSPQTLPADNFSARWTRQIFFEGGRYRFTTETDDGVRLFVDGALLIDRWHQMSVTSYTADVQLSRGVYTVRMEYFEQAGGARAKLTWQRLDSTPPPASNVWRGEYFNNMSLSGVPALVRNDSAIRFNWNAGSPDSAIGKDHFSVRWTREIRVPAGRYEFTTRTDDGVRLYVDNRLLIDEWRTTSAKTITKEIYLTEGTHAIRVEYFEQAGNAEANTWWEGPLASVTVGNIITCAGPAGTYSWVKVYRMEKDGSWTDVHPQGYGSIEATGWVKVSGLSVDYATYGDAGHPYRVEQWVDGSLVRSVGNTARGEQAFRVKAGQDNFTPWQCPQK
jgi:hypothetical protein